MQFKPDEITGIMNDFAEPGSLAPTGLFLAGTKYMVIQGEPGAVIRGKKVISLWFSDFFLRGFCTAVLLYLIAFLSLYC